MSPNREVAVQHHVYGTTERGFTSLITPEGVDRTSLIELERRGVYALPPGVRPEVGASTPTKRTCFTLGEKLVVGRTVYLGVDATGRLGNNVCHNILLDKRDAMAVFQDPVSLVVALEDAGSFIDDTPQASCELAASIEVTNESVVPNSLDAELARALLTLCFSWRPDLPPALIIGSEEDYLRLLAAVFSLVPQSIRWALPFDSYVFGADWRGLAMAGLPAQPEYASGLAAWSIRVDGSTGQWEWRQQIAEEPLVRALSNARSSIESRRAIAACIDLVGSGDWEGVRREICMVDDDGLAALQARFGDAFIAYLQSSGDAAFFNQVAAVLAPGQLERLATSERFAGLLDVGRTRSRIVAAAFDSGPKSPFLRWIAVDPQMLGEFLQKVTLLPDQVRQLALDAALLRLTRVGDVAAERLLLRAAVVAGRRGALGANSIYEFADAVRCLQAGTPAVAAHRLYVLDLLGDRSALGQLLDSPDKLIGFCVEQSESATSLLCSAVARGVGLRRALGTLVDGALAGRLDGGILFRLCSGVLRERTLDDKLVRRFAKELSAALKPALSVPWADSLRDMIDRRTRKDKWGSPRRGERR